MPVKRGHVKVLSSRSFAIPLALIEPSTSTVDPDYIGYQEDLNFTTISDIFMCPVAIRIDSF